MTWTSLPTSLWMEQNADSVAAFGPHTTLFGAHLDSDRARPQIKHVPYPAPAKRETPATLPYQRIKTCDIKPMWNSRIKQTRTLHLPGGQRIITWSSDGSIRVWDLEGGTQVGEEWADKVMGVLAMALSPDGKTIASVSLDGTVSLWNIDVGKVIKTWTGHTNRVPSVRWSPDGGRVVIRSDGTFRVWDVESCRTILGPIETGGATHAVCYSPDAKMIATSGDCLKVWDANTGQLLKTLEGTFFCLAWTSDALITGGIASISTFDTATWTETIPKGPKSWINAISLSPNGCILAGTSHANKTAQLWNLKTNQSIGQLFHHEDPMNWASFSADGKLLVTGCNSGDIYTWDISAIVEKADLFSDNVDATPQPPPKIQSSRRLPPGFFDDARNFSSTHTDRRTSTPHQRTLSRLSSFWRRSKPHKATENDTQPRSRTLSWIRNLGSGILPLRRHRSDIDLREPPIVEVPCTAGKPRNYHARKKKATSSPRPIAHNSQQPSGAAQNTPSSSQLPPPTATTSSLPAVAGTVGASGTISHPHVTVAGWRARFVGWICCVPIQHTDSQH